jgi:hypothetical protein
MAAPWRFSRGSPNTLSQSSRRAALQNTSTLSCRSVFATRLPLVFLPMKHVVVVYGDLRRQGQAAGLANQDILADFPMRAVLALTNQKFNFLFAAHL